MEITLIMAADENGVIGSRNRLPWHLPADLRYFVRHTRDKTLLMGRRTYESLRPGPERPNPLGKGRRLVVITGRPGEFPYEAEDVIPAGSVQEGLALAEAMDTDELMVCGGHSVFMEAWPWASRIRLTRVHGEFEGDTYIPDPDPDQWEAVETTYQPADADNPYACTFLVLERKRKEEAWQSP